MALNPKVQKVLGIYLKSVAFFAVAGAIVMLVAVHFVEKMFNDTIREATSSSQPQPAPSK